MDMRILEKDCVSSVSRLEALRSLQGMFKDLPCALALSCLDLT